MMENGTHTVKKNTHALGVVPSTAELEGGGKLTGSHPSTDKLVTTMTGTCKWQKTNIQALEATSFERDSKMKQFSKIYSFPFTYLLNALLIV